MNTEAEGLGRVYAGGEVIVRQGDVGECMFVVQRGRVEVVRESGGREVRLTVLGEGDTFGEMALFEREVRSATVRAMGSVQVLTVDKRAFMKRVHQDPSIAFNILKRMSRRIRELSDELAGLRSGS